MVNTSTIGKDLDKYLDEVAISSDILKIETAKGNRLVVMTHEEYITMQGLTRADADIAAGRVRPVSKVFAQADNIIEQAIKGL